MAKRRKPTTTVGTATTRATSRTSSRASEQGHPPPTGPGRAPALRLTPSPTLTPLGG